MAKQRKPWVHRGVRLGFIRGPVYWVDRTVAGVRYQVTTTCRTPDAAFLEYQRFEADPSSYRPRSQAPDGAGNWVTLASAYLAWTKNLKNNSAKHREETLDRLSNWGGFKGFASVDSFTKADVEAFVTALRNGKVTSRARKNHVTGQVEQVPSFPGQPTINRYLASLKGFLRWARENGHTKNEADRLVKMGKEKRNVRPPESIQSKRWLAVAAELDERWVKAQQVLLGSGMRYGELAKMREPDLREAGILVPDRKGRVGVVVPVSQATLASARRLLELGGVPDDSAGQMDHRLEDAAKAAGVKKYTAHHLRHTFATTVLRSKKVDLETLRLWLGHASIETTQKYLHAVRAEEGMPEGAAPF